ncbi:hypothetical protein IEQ34_008118 [Dendrobium chrysotoxum]|uniref:Uncharacterized protein n=1 Tax=Dendrobium chrysotoxum TaxID=161865 RepID=A0AAV7H4W6_DENCH|nr:hypothetical protein IEQ34_008118 [Dendrobium chrysotoxum]
MIPYLIRNTSKFINDIYDDTKEYFKSDITQWNLQSVCGLPTQTSNVDYRMFVYKYMKKVILKDRVDWMKYKNWQQEMPKIRAEFAYALFLSINK